MEAHPVPKNVLDVEFKLFGSLTVKQFGKILIGSIIALGLYFATSNFGIPVLLTGPLILASVLIGLGSALVPSFEVRVTGLMKAFFSLPRYVWGKKTKTPDILSGRMVQESQRAAGVSPQQIVVSQQQDSATIDDLSIDQILAARSTLKDDDDIFPAQRESSNFGRVYEEQFGTSLNQSLQNRERQLQPQSLEKPEGNLAQSTTTPQQVQVPISTQAAVQINPVRNDVKRDSIDPQAVAAANALVQQPQSAVQLSPEQMEQIKQEINLTRAEIASLNKLEGRDEEKKVLMEKLNQLFAQAGLSSAPKTDAVPATSVSVEAIHTLSLFGVVVDKQDKPVVGAEIKLLDVNLQELGPVVPTVEDGTFVLPVPEGLAEVVIQIKKDPLKFHPFKIKINQTKMPAFKFREH